MWAALTARDYDKWFTSEHYPSDYTNNQTCQWSISAAAGYSVNLNIYDLELAAGDVLTASALICCALQQLQQQGLTSMTLHAAPTIHTCTDL